MPQIERVAREFADKGVELIAINQQETVAQITAMLERQKLSPTVALDRDGVVSDKYEADSIPQTVIIDREGKVAKLYVGGGPKFGDQLREALQALMPEAKPEAAVAHHRIVQTRGPSTRTGTTSLTSTVYRWTRRVAGSPSTGLYRIRSTCQRSFPGGASVRSMAMSSSSIPNPTAASNDVSASGQQKFQRPAPEA